MTKLAEAITALAKELKLETLGAPGIEVDEAKRDLAKLSAWYEDTSTVHDGLWLAIGELIPMFEVHIYRKENYEG